MFGAPAHTSHAYELRRSVLREKTENEQVTVAEIVSLRHTVDKLLTRIAVLERHQRVINPDAFDLLCRRVERLETAHLELGLHTLAGHVSTFDSTTTVRRSPFRQRGLGLAESVAFQDPRYRTGHYEPTTVLTAVSEGQTLFGTWVEEMVDRANLAIQAAREQSTALATYALQALQLRTRPLISPTSNAPQQKPNRRARSSSVGALDTVLSPLSSSMDGLDELLPLPSMNASTVERAATADPSFSDTMLPDFPPGPSRPHRGGFGYDSTPPKIGLESAKTQRDADVAPKFNNQILVESVLGILHNVIAGGAQLSNSDSIAALPQMTSRQFDTMVDMRNAFGRALHDKTKADGAKIEEEPTLKPAEALKTLESAGDRGDWICSVAVQFLRDFSGEYCITDAPDWTADFIRVINDLRDNRLRIRAPSDQLLRSAKGALVACTIASLSVFSSPNATHANQNTFERVVHLAVALITATNVDDTPVMAMHRTSSNVSSRGALERVSAMLPAAAVESVSHLRFGSLYGRATSSGLHAARVPPSQHMATQQRRASPTPTAPAATQRTHVAANRMRERSPKPRQASARDDVALPLRIASPFRDSFYFTPRSIATPASNTGTRYIAHLH
jgi:hypothetical protein